MLLSLEKFIKNFGHSYDGNKGFVIIESYIRETDLWLKIIKIKISNFTHKKNYTTNKDIQA